MLSGPKLSFLVASAVQPVAGVVSRDRQLASYPAGLKPLEATPSDITANKDTAGCADAMAHLLP